MNPNRSSVEEPSASAQASFANDGWFAAWTRFWFCPADTLGLGVMRVLTAVVLQLWLLSLTGNVDSLFGLSGWIDQQAYADLAKIADETPPGWSVIYLTHDNPALLTALHLGTGLLSLLFGLGVCTRLTSVLCWVAVVSFTANPAIETDADVFLVLLMFYMMVAHVLVGQRQVGQPLWARILGPLPSWLKRSSTEVSRFSVGANVGVRLLQVHFAVAVVISGLHKLQAGEWWSGIAFWYYLYPPLETTLSVAQEHKNNPRAFMALLSASAYAVLAWQLAFPFFAWRSRWRWLLMGGAVVAWLGSAFLYKVPLLGPAFFACCVAFVTPEEWRGWMVWLRALLGRSKDENAAGMHPPAARGADAASSLRVGQRT